ncbi:MAG: DEAD/DEAH box helicase, partial [Mobilicoccus sp.]|nr:DEAD/DEAH box helicase [Mobilicoccus sp.]
MAARHTTDHGPLAGSIHLPGHELPEPVPPSRSVRLTTPLTALFPTRTCNALAAKRGIETVEDLLWFVPTRFSQVATSMSHLWPSRYLVTTGEVLTVKTKPMSGRKGSMLSATVDTPSGELAIVFFNAYGHQDRIKVGEYGLFQGPVTTFNRSWQISHPFYDMLPGEPRGPVRLDRSIVPMYREVKQMTTWTIGHCARIVLDALDMDDPLPEEILRGRDLPTFIEAMRLRHRPATREDLATARRRFAYDEALAIQVVLAERRKQAQAGIAVPRKPRRDGLLARFDERLPFELTDGQKAVGAEITADLAKDRPMLRLLQGEVGSGKTLVALRAMLAVVDAGGQSALLAPTEVLATQHHRSMSAMLGDLAEPGMLGGALDGTRVTLLTGSMSTAARKKAMLQIASGEAGIVVGTHALIQDKVSFASLGLVVVDEQHRFGVEQRDALGANGEGEPHVLVMTATPIPRTVAMT